MALAPLVLVTAGNTRERIDDVRDWGNVFTGNTGYAIARACAAKHRVRLLTSNRVHAAEIIARGNASLSVQVFTTHAELRALLAAEMKADAYAAVFMTAAVSDYRPTGVYEIVSRTPTADGETWTVKNVQAAKVKSHHSAIAIAGEPTEKLVDLFRGAFGYRGLLVKFKLEVGIGKDELLAIGRKSRVASGADYLVANTLDMVDGAAAGAYLIGEGCEEFVPRSELAERLAGLVL